MRYLIILFIQFAMLSTTEAQHYHEQPPSKSKQAPVKKVEKKKIPVKKVTPVKKRASVKKTSMTELKIIDTSHRSHDMRQHIAKDSIQPVIDTHTMHDSAVHDMGKLHADSNHKMHADTTPHHMHSDTAQAKADMNHDEHSMSTHEKHDMNAMPMTHMYSLSLPMNRNASGTAWNPDNTPMYMYMRHGDKSMWMFHGSLFLRYNNQELNGTTSRSASKFDAPNWMMAMYSRKIGANGLFGFSAMLSLDPITVGKNGYPLLFQSGETFQGKPLVDRQHPHDLFSELAVSYTHRVNSKVDVFAYVGYPGEPALSAPAFMHRISAMNDPDAPLGHHWQDATHITFGVATLGVRLGKFKLEGSSFTGREPNENRYNFDKPLFDSYSYRLSFNPSKTWALQFSQGFIKSPEALHPDDNVKRTTASALYSSPVRNNKFFAAAMIWGLNDAGDHHKEHSVLAEATQQLNKQAIYGRYEFVQKSADELDVESTVGHGTFDLHKLSIGTNRKIAQFGNTALMIGGHISFNVPAPALQTLYGNMPIAGQLYLQIRPELFK